MASVPSRSPAAAASAASSSRLVVLAIAETTTTGWRERRSRTIPATRSIAAALSTELPPNFMTIMTSSPSGADQPLALHHLGLEQGGARRPAQDVVGEGGELPMEEVALAQPS